jgi:hypothetical protein
MEKSKCKTCRVEEAGEFGVCAHCWQRHVVALLRRRARVRWRDRRNSSGRRAR